MNREQIRSVFRTTGTIVLPVIHVLDAPQALSNMSIAFGEGATGIFLINHDFQKEDLLPILETARKEFPEAWIGVNFLAVTGLDAFPVLGDLERQGVSIDAYWADNARIDETRAETDQPEADAIDAARAASNWRGLYFGGTAFKVQRAVPAEFFGVAARIAARHMDVVTTSGLKTGMAPDLSKIRTFRSALNDRALALASGVTPDNAGEYAPFVDAFLVATGINHEGDFYNIDPKRLKQLISICGTATVYSEETT